VQKFFICGHLSAFFSLPFSNFGLSNQIKMETHLIQRKTFFTRQLIIELVCYAYILVFIYAAVYKLFDQPFFEKQLELSPLLGNFSKSTSYLVPMAEVLACILLALPKHRKCGLWFSGLIMVAFTLYILYILTLSDSIPCACGGILNSMGWTEHLVFNIVFVGMSTVALTLTYKK
jgi:hypothetical protein